MGFRLIQRKSEYQDKKVWVLKDSKTGYYKQITMGERAEFSNKPQAQTYINQVRKSFKKPIHGFFHNDLPIPKSVRKRFY